MFKRMLIMLIIVLAVFGIVFSWYGFKKYMFAHYMANYQPPPITISATHAELKSWQPLLNSVGTLKAENGVDVSSEVSGIVSEIRFKSGEFVQQNAVLVLLDTAVEQAALHNDQAQLKLAQLNYNRRVQLSQKNFAAQSDVDTAKAKLEETTSAVEADKAKIEQKTIKAPFSGKIGINLINLGQFVKAGDTIVTLQSLDPLLVQFSLPEQDLPSLAIGQPVELTVSAYNNKIFNGLITAINSKVDQTTRSILVQATIPNKQGQLYPGMFAAVKVILPQKNKVVTLPQTAISYSLHGDSVYLIKEEGKDASGKPSLHAYRQYVTVGERRNNEVSILKGINAGDLVVTSGQLKLQNGATVAIDNTVEL